MCHVGRMPVLTLYAIGARLRIEFTIQWIGLHATEKADRSENGIKCDRHYDSRVNPTEDVADPHPNKVRPFQNPGHQDRWEQQEHGNGHCPGMYISMAEDSPPHTQ